MKEKLSIKSIDQSQLLLRLFESQIEATREEVISNAANLGTSFEALFNIANDLQKLGDSKQDFQEHLNDKCSSMFESIGECITALQSSDAISQRLEHANIGLLLVRELITNADDCNSGLAWSALKKKIRQSYSIEEERKIFDKLINGVEFESVKNNGDNISGC